MAPVGTLYAPEMKGPPRLRKICATAALAAVELAPPETPLEPDITNKTPEYRAKFPLGKIPAFESADGSFRLVESDAIAAYVAALAPDSKVRLALLGGTLEERALVQQWVSFNSLHFEPTVLRLAEGEPTGENGERGDNKDGLADWTRWVTYLETHLSNVTQEGTNKWVVPIGGAAEGCPSIADVSLAAVLWGGCRVFMDSKMRESFPESIKWLQQIRTHPKIAQFFAGPLLGEKA